MVDILLISSLNLSFWLFCFICNLYARDNTLKIFIVSIFFSETMVADHGICYNDLRKEIKILVTRLF